MSILIPCGLDHCCLVSSMASQVDCMSTLVGKNPCSVGAYNGKTVTRLELFLLPCAAYCVYQS